MHRAVTRDLAGWGRFPVQRCHVNRPERRADVATLLQYGEQASYIARGRGRSYGDAALNRDAGVVDHTRLDHLLAYEPETGVVECEAGVSLATLVDTFTPRGHFLAVTPGTRHVSVGGAIAANVHGKNHHRDGAFASSVESFELVTATGKQLTCSRGSNPELFWATLGGMGLTGAITTARLRLRPIESAWIRVDRARTRDLGATLDHFDDTDDAYPYSVAWIDLVARGRRRGRSVVFQGEHASSDEAPTRDPLTLARHRPRRVRADAPQALLTHASVAAFNALYHRTHPSARGRLEPLSSFFYPLDGLDDWNRLYGRRGFAQYQFVVPRHTALEAIPAVLEALDRAKRPPFLAVLKRMGAGDPGPLSFPREGVTLALDLAAWPGIRAFLQGLDEIVLAHGGRVYLAKDACLSPEAFRAMYPDHEGFQRLRRELDPDGRIASSLSRRLALDPPQEAAP